MLTFITLLFVFITLLSGFLQWISIAVVTNREMVAIFIVGTLWALMGTTGFYHTFL